ncbi:MAG: DMT family transporter [Actinomycetota bacterium]|nr:DMT family transporter [Actinomycetota bacterium]
MTVGTPARTRTQAFTPRDWGLLLAVALMWGSSFLLIEIALTDLQPTAVTWLRILFGAVTLACVPAARCPVARADWPLVALLGLVWMAVPFTLFPFAQQSISSSLAGMVNGAAPLFTMLVATVWSRRLPSRRQLAGLVVGFGGVVAINTPALREADATTLGAVLVLLATLCYGIAFNLAVPLEERNGALPVIWRAQLVALLLVSGPGVVGATHSSWSWSAVLVTVLLGALSTGLAFAFFTVLAGRVGAARGSVTVYFIPVVAILLGVLLASESVTAVALVGTALVLFGAYLTSRKERDPSAAGCGVKS